jgi:hypothetical protein
MQLKNYIAAVLLMIFLGKMISMDSKILGMIFESYEVTLVSNLCPKKQLQTNSVEEVSEDNLSLSFEIGYLCHAAYDIQLHDSSQALAENNFRKYFYHVPGNFSISGDKFYPPPKA